MKILNLTRIIDAVVYVTVAVLTITLWSRLMQPAHSAIVAVRADTEPLDQRQRVSPESGSRGGVLPVLVEFFPSEDCAKCPDADPVLANLVREQPIRGAEIIVLREGMERSSSGGHGFPLKALNLAERRKAYQTYSENLDNNSEPEAIVDGSLEVDATDGEAIQRAVEKAESNRKLILRLTGVNLIGDTISFTLAGRLSIPTYVDVYAALLHEIPAGGSTLTTLQQLPNIEYFGRIGSSWRMADLGERPFAFQAHWTGDSAELRMMRLVVFVQTKHIGPVLGIASCSLPRSDSAETGQPSLKERTKQSLSWRPLVVESP